MQNIVMATVEFSLYNTEKKFTDLSGNELLISFKPLIGLKITLVKFTYSKGKTGCLPLCLIILSCCFTFLGHKIKRLGLYEDNIPRLWSSGPSHINSPNLLTLCRTPLFSVFLRCLRSCQTSQKSASNDSKEEWKT